MLRKTFTLIFVAATAAAFTFGAAGKADPVSGIWHVVFSIAGQTAEGTMKLKLDRDKITGTVETAHTGPGTLSNGKWADGKMSFTADFAKHESIDITGSPKDGKLSGDFKTEGMAGTWIGTKE